MSELNAEQIKKALELCSNNDGTADCEPCNFNMKSVNCLNVLMKNALSLIKKLTEENERLRADLAKVNKDKQILFDEIASLEAQAEKAIDIAEDNIRAEIASGGTSCHWCEDKVRSDTVRKIQERLNAEAITIQDHTGKLGLVVLVSDIDQIAKEILEGE